MEEDSVAAVGDVGMEDAKQFPFLLSVNSMTHIKNQKGWCLRSDARAPQTRQSGSVSPVKIRS